MINFLLFILISVGIGILILLSYRGHNSDEIKETLKAILESIKNLLSSFIKLFVLIRETIEKRSNQEEISEQEENKEKTTSIDELKEDSIDSSSLEQPIPSKESLSEEQPQNSNQSEVSTNSIDPSITLTEQPSQEQTFSPTDIANTAPLVEQIQSSETEVEHEEIDKKEELS